MAKATVLEEFTTIVPFNFEDPSFKTTVKIFSNAEGIYVGFIKTSKINKQFVKKITLEITGMIEEIKMV